MKNVFKISIKSFSLFLLLTQFTMQAQETASVDITPQKTEKKIIELKKYTIKGTVIDDENNPLSDVNVVLKGSREGTVTDENGAFEFPKQLEVNDVLVFSYIGFSPQEYRVQENTSETITISITFDFSKIDLLGEVEVDGAYTSKCNIFQKFFDLFR